MVKRFNDNLPFESRNYYGDLGLGVERWGADYIKKAYRTLSLKWHPDRNPGNKEAEARMKRINEAYGLLVTEDGKELTVYENAIRDLLKWGKGCRRVPKFECAECHYQGEYLFKKVEGKNYCNYFCLPNCANELSDDKECKSDYGKCWSDNLVRSKQHGIFCSSDCFNIFKKNLEEQKNWEDKWKCIKCKKTINGSYYTKKEGLICATCNGDEEKNWKCFWCKGGFCEKNEKGENSFWRTAEDLSLEFCSRKCVKEWRKSLEWDNEELEKEEFINNKLKTLIDWNLLSDEEKQNFIEQVNNSEPEQFENIVRQAKKLIREKQALNSQERRSRQNNSGENGISDGESDSGYGSNNSDSTESEEISNLLSLTQSQTQAEQKIQGSLKNSGISEAKLNQILGSTDWKEALKKLDTPQKVEEFINKIEQEILKIKLSKQSNSTKDKSPKNGWVLPVIILVLSFLVLTSLVLIVRKRKQRGF